MMEAAEYTAEEEDKKIGAPHTKIYNFLCFEIIIDSCGFLMTLFELSKKSSGGRCNSYTNDVFMSIGAKTVMMDHSKFFASPKKQLRRDSLMFL
jgi:hypothetical protein